MRKRIANYYRMITGNYWFVPMVMALAAGGLAVGTIYLDWWVGTSWNAQLAWLKASSPSGARELLSVVAGSMITVAGVTFSMTVVSVSFASAQFGPRLIGNFMRNKGNQVTLGTYIATFVYCLVVLRSIRTAEDADKAQVVESFVPQISLLVALGLALASVAVLIYFIHHVPETINISNITADIGSRLKKHIKTAFSEKENELSKSWFHHAQNIEQKMGASSGLYSNYDCYLQSINEAGLVQIACNNDVVLRTEFRPGTFVAEGEVLVRVWPKEKLTEKVESQILRQFTWTTDKTMSEGYLFLIDELLEIIARALSPGVNDPYTAINCLNWLKTALITAAQGSSPTHLFFDEKDELRLINQPISFKLLTDRIFDQSRAYICTDRNAAIHQMRLLCDIGSILDKHSDRQVLLEQARLLKECCADALKTQHDKDLVFKSYEVTYKTLSQANTQGALRNSKGWLSEPSL